MAATGRRSNGSSVLCPLSSSHHHHHHHRHQRSSASPCNINLRLKRFSLGNNPNNPSAAAVSNQKRRCSCSPTTHPGSFRCGFHRRLENERIKTLASSNNKSSKSDRSGTLYLRKLALVNSLARIGSVEAERFRKYLTESMVKPSSSLLIRRRFEFRARPSRFYVMHKDPKD